VIGFCLGGFTGILLLFLLKEKHLFLIPVLALGGAFLGRFIGNALLRFM
jgi:VIT1/CCC1 family predicted Fe2+/Mn2+ transporter